MSNYVFHKKSELIKIDLNSFNIAKPDLKNSSDTKAIAVAKWIMKWIDEGLKLGNLKVGHLLPTKQEFAYFLGVSIGTMQNALRYIEDKNYVESKQRIGTIIKDKNSIGNTVRKLTSKRELAINEVIQFIIKNRIKPGSVLPSSRTLATLINCSFNTTRLALEYLCSKGYISNNSKTSYEGNWLIISTNFNSEFCNCNNKETLVVKVEKDIKQYISENLKVGDNIPSHDELASLLKVSIKTVHDALKLLIDDGYLIARRGRYGTVVVKLPTQDGKSEKVEKSIFAPAKDAAFYYYEKTQNTIKNMISEKYEIGSKLPSIMELSRQMDLSPNTIRKAFHNLAKEGYLVFSRGRYGGTFVVDVPRTVEEPFKWLSVNPQYTNIYDRQVSN